MSKQKSKSITATVVYPVTFDVLNYAKHQGDKEIVKLLEKKKLTEEETDQLREYIFDSADSISTGAGPLIHECDIPELID